MIVAVSEAQSTSSHPVHNVSLPALCLAGSIFHLAPRVHVITLAVALLVVSSCTLGVNIFGTWVMYRERQLQDLASSVGSTLSWRTVKVGDVLTGTDTFNDWGLASCNDVLTLCTQCLNLLLLLRMSLNADFCPTPLQLCR